MEYLKFPFEDNKTGFPSTVTSATSTLSFAIPLIVPLLPIVLLATISSIGALISALIIFSSFFCLSNNIANLRSNSMRFCLSLSSSAEVIFDLGLI